MTVETSIEVRGLKEALAELNKVAPTVRRELTKSIKGDAKPLIDAARALIPNEAPLSGMTSGRFAWSTKARSQVGIKMGGRARGDQFTILSLRQNNPAGSIFDIAGKRGGKNARGQQFIANLAARYGRPSRAMWPAAEQALPQIIEEITQTIDDALSEINRNLVTK